MPEDEAPPRITVEEADLRIREATMRQLLEESEFLVEEAKLALDLLEACIARMRQTYAQIGTALARAAERRK